VYGFSYPHTYASVGSINFKNKLPPRTSPEHSDSGLSILRPDYFCVLMYNLFNLLLNPLLISHCQDLNFGTVGILRYSGTCKAAKVNDWHLSR
jgi:hypothetical protein